MPEENHLWKGSPSQWLNLWNYLASIVAIIGISIGGVFYPLAFIALIIPILWMVWCYLVVRCKVFELTTERLRITEGVINQHIDEIELYRVKDNLMRRPWWMRITGLASIDLHTSDRSLPELTIPAIPNGIELRETLRKQVELVREKKRVREMDFDDTGGSGDLEML